MTGLSLVYSSTSCVEQLKDLDFRPFHMMSEGVGDRGILIFGLQNDPNV